MSSVSRHRRVVSESAVSAEALSRVPSAKVTTGARVDRLALAHRARPRAVELLASVSEIDSSVDPSSHAAIMDWIRSEYDARQGGMLMGLFATCHLGPPYIDHKLSLSQDILQHYSPTEDPGYPFSLARGLVRSGAYAFVEIYSDGSIVPVRHDGTSVDYSPAT